MVFHFLYAVEPQSILWLTLNQSINEINNFLAPSVQWDLIELHLFCKDFFANFFAIYT